MIAVTSMLVAACSSDGGSNVQSEAAPLVIAQQRPGLLGINASATVSDAAEVKELRARRVRVEFKMPNPKDPTPITDRAHWDIEREKAFAAFADGMAAYAAIPGLRVLMTVDYMSVPQREHFVGSASDFKKYIDEFVYHLAAIVDHYTNDVDIWEIWNEPDTHGAGPVNSALFVPLLQESSAAVRKHAKPSATIISGVASVLYWQDLERDAKPLGVAHISSLVDAINLHPYDNWPGAAQSTTYAADFVPASGGGQSLAEVLKRADALSGGKPFWFTEYGDRGAQADDAEESAYLSEFFQFMASPAPLVDRVHEAYFFNLRDFNDSGKVVRTGLFSGSRKKSAWTVFLKEASK
jgi:hypothetical protein